MKEVGLNNILPSYYYPLEGQIILREKDEKNIVLVGLFRINKDSDTIYITTDSNQCYPKYEKQIDKRVVNISCESFKSYYDYELVAKAKLIVGDTETDNVCITGTGKINGNFESTMESRRDEINCEFQPLFDTEGHYCNMNVW